MYVLYCLCVYSRIIITLYSPIGVEMCEMEHINTIAQTPLEI